MRSEVTRSVSPEMLSQPSRNAWGLEAWTQRLMGQMPGFGVPPFSHHVTWLRLFRKLLPLMAAAVLWAGQECVEGTASK